jgi:protein phosphatase
MPPAQDSPRSGLLRRADPGPYDLVGDVHGCLDELVDLLAALGHGIDGPAGAPRVEPAPGRTVVFVGDLVDRGPATPGVLRLVMDLVARGAALVARGNHDDKLARKLAGREVSVGFGLQESLDQLAAEPAAFHERARAFLDGLPHQLLLDGGALVVTHAGLREELHGVDSKQARALCLYGETSGERDERGYPVRLDWAAEYRGEARVVQGHTPVPSAGWRNRVLNLDTGCVFGGALTALRYPELELVSVPARRVHYEGL